MSQGCGNCDYWRSPPPLPDQIAEPPRRGDCRRFPVGLPKLETEWCGEHSQHQLDRAFAPRRRPVAPAEAKGGD